MHTSSSRLKPTRRLHKNSVRPRNVRPPKSLPATQPLRKPSRKGRPSRSRAARRDSAVHVSLSSDSLVKQPGTCAVPLSGQAGEPSKLHTSDRDRKLGSPNISEVLHRRDIVPRGGRRAVWVLYSLAPGGLSTLNAGLFTNPVPEPAATKPPLHSRLLAIRRSSSSAFHSSADRVPIDGKVRIGGKSSRKFRSRETCAGSG